MTLHRLPHADLAVTKTPRPYPAALLLQGLFLCNIPTAIHLWRSCYARSSPASLPHQSLWPLSSTLGIDSGFSWSPQTHSSCPSGASPETTPPPRSSSQEDFPKSFAAYQLLAMDSNTTAVRGAAASSIGGAVASNAAAATSAIASIANSVHHPLRPTPAAPISRRLLTSGSVGGKTAIPSISHSVHSLCDTLPLPSISTAFPPIAAIVRLDSDRSPYAPATCTLFLSIFAL
ncbi:hypothetical protein DFH09DRAFT_1311837 [Mycena vulgaris]|nr:hypothetical protein DFH09DRAFT_1311837 [Mycena vulgaris]